MILGLFDTAASLSDERVVRDLLACSGVRTGDAVRVHAEPGAVLGVAAGASGSAHGAFAYPAFAIDDDYVVAADASLYYLSDLRRKLGRDVAPTASPAQLVLAAFRAMGRACVDHLEGDFAFVIWDRHARRVFCARDFTGRRPLFIAEWRGGLIVATSLDSIACLPGFDARVNVTAVGADAAGLLFALDDETCMEGVHSLRAGYAAHWSPGEPLRTERVWHAGPVEPSAMGFDQAAEQLRELLVAAVRERFSASTPTAVWMSGGRDSTAVFAAGMHARRTEGFTPPLIPVSRSHPVGDSGREDEMIEEIARFWSVAPRWVDAQRVPMFSTFRNRTQWSAEPFAQPFEGLTRALAESSAAAGACVALDGYGGDFLFQVSGVYLADLVGRGRLKHALTEWRAMDGGREGYRGFFSRGVQPLLPRWATQAIGAVRGGRPLSDSMERLAPPWIASQFVQKHGLRERFASLGPAAQKSSSAAERETQFYLSHQYFARVNSKMAGFALDHGVELRSPLLDRRIVQFALSRPREERNCGGDRKLLLRAAMRGLLPDSVLAARQGKTGTLRSYFAKHMRSDGVARLGAMLPAPALTEAGIVNPADLAWAVARYRAEGSRYPHSESLFCTLHAEAWLRARNGAATGRRTTREKLVVHDARNALSRTAC